MAAPSTKKMLHLIINECIYKLHSISQLTILNKKWRNLKYNMNIEITKVLIWKKLKNTTDQREKSKSIKAKLAISFQI